MSLISFIKSNWSLLFFLTFFIIIFLCIVKKSYKLLVSFMFTYIMFLSVSGFFFIIQKKKNIEDRRKFVLEKKAEAVILSPSVFLKYKDGRSSIDYLKYDFIDENIQFPLGTMINKKIIVCEEDEGPISRISDRYGFFNNDNLWKYQNHDILLVGDSHANGECVEETPFKTLNEKYGIKTINLGHGGNGPLTTYAVTKEYLNKFDSEFIYYVLSTNDYSRENFSVLAIDFEREVFNKTLLMTLKSDFLQNYFTNGMLNGLSENLFQHSEALMLKYTNNKSEINIDYLKNFFSLRFLLINSYNIIIPILKPGIRFLSKKNEKLLIETYEKTNQLKSDKIIFIIRPNINCGIRDNTEYSYIRNILELSKIKEENIIDTTRQLCNKKLWSVKGNHLNKEGYSVLTELIKQDYEFRKKN
jgi:hypothetical protein